MKLAQVAVAAPIRNQFTYIVSTACTNNLQAGCLVDVPFGRMIKRGVVTKIHDQPPPPGVALKEISRMLEPDPVVDRPLLDTLLWGSNYYLCPPGEMIFAALPATLRKSKPTSGQHRIQFLVPIDTIDSATIAALDSKAPCQARVLRTLLSQGKTCVAEFCRTDPGARQAIKTLIRKGLVLVEEQAQVRRPAMADLPPPLEVKNLTQEQAAACSKIQSSMDRNAYDAFLLHGVTGSGKTEVYLRAIGHALQAGRSAILLVPEISLTPQLLSIVYARFQTQVAVLHSGLLEGERLDEWHRLRKGEARVAVGARSAVFAPVRNLGLVVVDEEHDPSYKQSDRLPYNGRDLAMVRAKSENAVVILGTATPSVESYTHALSGRSKLLTLTQRVQQRGLPSVEVVDLKKESVDPLERPHTIGPALAAALAETLDRKEQAILFLNRRGYSSLVLCQDCGEGIRCKNCSVALVHHLKEQMLRCHYCGLSIAIPSRCPSCGGGRVQPFGLGTEKCEEEVRRRFPGARVMRLDSDSVSKRGTLHSLLSKFARKEVDVLVGTQMVTKGHDIPGVTLVGVVLADLGLQIPDFRAAERTFQLITQVAGRAGRGEKPGRVVVQTFLPFHPSIVLAREHRFDDFFQREREKRTQLGYPPAKKLLMVRFSHTDEKTALGFSQKVAREFNQIGGRLIQLLGPAPSPISKIRGRFRFQLLIKSGNAKALQEGARMVLKKFKPPTGMKILFDMDPIDML
jgi:primosomal protein N' (replication factor Y) (superfamily II helicase)